MSDEAKSTLISARGELHRVARDLKRYLRWQKASGSVGSTPAPAEDRAAFEAVKKAREQAKLDRLKRGLRADKPAEKKTAPAVPDAPHTVPGTPKSPPKEGAQPAERPRFSPGKTTQKPSAPDLAAQSKSTPWKSTQNTGSRPTRRFDPASTAAKQAVTPQPAPAKPAQTRSAPAASTDDAPEYDASFESYAMQFSQMEEAPPEYHPGEPLYAAPPGQSAQPGASARPKKDPSTMSKQEKLDFLRNYMGDCRRCGLCQGRSHVVFGRGNPDARLVFVAHAPDAIDDQKGDPFSDDLIAGKADGLFAKMVAAMGLSLDDVYLCTVVKCRPPGDRAPQVSEVKECAPFLYKQLGVIEPQVIVALGGFATAVLAGEDPSKDAVSRNFATKTRGHWQSWRGVAVMPTFHPAELLASTGQAQRQLKGAAWQDLKSVMDKLGLKSR